MTKHLDDNELEYLELVTDDMLGAEEAVIHI